MKYKTLSLNLIKMTKKKLENFEGCLHFKKFQKNFEDFKGTFLLFK